MLPNDMLKDLKFHNYLRVSEAAAILGVSPDTLRRWGNTKKISTYRHPINRYRLYRQSELERLLSEVKIT